MRRVGPLLGSAGLYLFAAFGILAAMMTAAGVLLGYQIQLISTGSMTPTLPVGSAVLTQQRSTDTVEPGDIVAIDSERLGAPVIHRVTEIEHHSDGTATIQMQGDANDAADPFPYEGVSEVSAYVFHIPGAAEVVAFLGQPVTILGIGLVASLLILWAFWPRDKQKAAATDHQPRHTTAERKELDHA